MPEVLVDTSAWVEFFRRGRGAVGETIDSLLDQELVRLCGVVEMELLHGVRHSERPVLAELLGSLPSVGTEREDFVAAGERLSELRQAGVSIPATDALIAVLCLRHDLELLTLDRHFDHFPDLKRLAPM